MKIMSTVLDQILDVLPTSRTIQNFVPSVPQVDCRGHWRSCSKSVSKTCTKFINAILTQILKNPHQSVAICFLIGLGGIFFLGCQESEGSSKYAAIRGGAGGMDILAENDKKDNVAKAAHERVPKVNLPTHFNYLNKNDAQVKSTPVFWYLPRSGGNTVTEIFGKCRGMVIAGAWMGPTGSLKIVHEHGMKQVTADLSTKDGRSQARDMGLKDAHPYMLVLSPNVYETSDIFAGSFQAELWTWFREPVERQISYYFYLKTRPLGHPQHNPAMQFLSLSDWTQSQMHIPNAMLSTLLGVPTNPMGWTEMDLTVAKNLLREKAKIGLLEQKTESIRRFLYGRTIGASGARECQERLLDYAWTTKGHHDQIGKKSDAYQLLLQSNSLDVKLYEYAVYLFEEQGKLFV